MHCHAVNNRRVGCCKVTILSDLTISAYVSMASCPRAFGVLLRTLDISEGLPDAANMPHSASGARWIVSLQGSLTVESPRGCAGIRSEQRADVIRYYSFVNQNSLQMGNLIEDNLERGVDAQPQFWSAP
jgi:hypothetical protein